LRDQRLLVSRATALVGGKFVPVPMRSLSDL